MHNNQAIVNKGSKRTSLRLTSMAVLAIATVVPAMATDPVPNDYTASITAFKDAMSAFFVTNGPALLGALVVLLAFGIVWKLVKRAAKSV